MNTDALFDRIASELAGAGAVEDRSGATRSLSMGGTPFARLTHSGAEVYLPPGCPARDDALARPTTSEADDGWVAVSVDDAAAWPTLFEQALHGVR